MPNILLRGLTSDLVARIRIKSTECWTRLHDRPGEAPLLNMTLRNLPADLVSRVRAYADKRGLSPRDATERLIRDGLGRDEARQAGAAARQAATTPEQRSATARLGAQARWAKAKSA